MKILQSKYGHKVQVSHSISVTRDSLHVIEVQARCGKTLEVSRITIGAVDGKRPPPPTKEGLQSLLDRNRVRVANEASWKERVRETIQEIE
jgi:hypothetical protein